MDKVLIFTERYLHNAPRVIRQIKTLEKYYEIHTVGYSAFGKTASHTNTNKFKPNFYIRLIKKIKYVLFKKEIPNQFIYKSKYKKIRKKIDEINPKIVIVHDVLLLPYFTNLKLIFNFKLVFNAHEYYPLEFEDRKNWNSTFQPFYENIYTSNLPNVDLFINVCESIRIKCLEKYNKNSIVIPNATFFHDLKNLNNENNKIIKLIHHGGAQQSRKIEEMIKIIQLLGKGYELNLMLTPTDIPYLKHLKNKYSNIENLKFLEPVSFNEIVSSINKYDIGIYILPPTNYNNSIALPNKLFEFIQARLCIAIGPSPEMSYIVNKYKLGVVAKDFTAESLATEIKKLSKEKILEYKIECDKNAKLLSAENYNNLFLQKIKEL